MDVVQKVAEGTYSVQMHGQFTFADHPVFRGIIQTIETNPQIARISFSMEKLIFVDSAALGMLLLAHDAADKTNKKIGLTGVSGQVRKIFEMAHFQDLFDIE